MQKLIPTKPKTCLCCGLVFHRKPKTAISHWKVRMFCSTSCKKKHQKTDEVPRFWSKVKKGSGCWIWSAKSKMSYGYGVFHVNSGKSQIGAHRYSYLLHFGKIPDGQSVCHRCDNPSCVRPDHLFVGTQKDNLADMTNKKRRRTGDRKGEKNGRAKLSDGDVRKIRSMYPSQTQKVISERFGVAQAYVSRLIRNKIRVVKP